MPTAYEVQGSTLTQHVDTSEAAFPVVADPSLEWHWYWGPLKAKVWFRRAETRSIDYYLAVYGVSYAALNVACGYIPYWPAKAACQAVVLSTLADFLYNVKQATKRRQCLTAEIWSTPPQRVDWDDGGGGRCT